MNRIMRKKIANLKIQIKKAKNIVDKINLIEKLCTYEKALPTLGDLHLVLEKNTLSAKQDCLSNVTFNKFKKWALLKAVQEFFCGKNNTQAPIVDFYGSNELNKNFKMDFQYIYNRYIEIMFENVKMLKKTLSDDQIEENLQDSVISGFDRGSAFEKQLVRYKDDFIKQVWGHIVERI